MFNREKYEKADIKEQVKIYSQTEPGYIFVCSRKRCRKPVFKWKDYYFSIVSNLPKTIEDLQEQLLYGNPNTQELEELLKFINSKSDSDFTISSYGLIKIVWNSFHSSKYVIE